MEYVDNPGEDFRDTILAHAVKYGSLRDYPGELVIRRLHDATIIFDNGARVRLADQGFIGYKVSAADA